MLQRVKCLVSPHSAGDTCGATVSTDPTSSQLAAHISRNLSADHRGCSMLVLLVLLGVAGAGRAKSLTRQMTVQVEAGTEYCFFLPNVLSGQTLDFDFQVTDSTGATSNHDIDVRITAPGPDFEEIFNVERENDGSYSEEVHHDGDYEVCLDNEMSTISDKVVWFEVAVHDPTDDYYDDYIEDDDWKEMVGRNEDTESLFDVKVDDVKTFLHNIRVSLGKIRHFQLMLGADYSSDTNQVRANMDKIDLWSVLHLAVLLVVGFTQIFMVKQLFEDRSFLYKLVQRT